MSSSPITIRQAHTGDVFELVRLRRRIYEDMCYSDTAALEAMSSLTAAYLNRAVADGSFCAWVACDAERVIAAGAVLITAWPAHPYDLECRRATILNVYTEPSYRRPRNRPPNHRNHDFLVQAARLGARHSPRQRRWPAPLRVPGI